MPRSVCLLASLLVIVGCAAQPPTASSQFDGHYVGDSARTRDGSICGPDIQSDTVAIAGGHFDYTFLVINPTLSWQPQPVTVSVAVAADGSFDGGTMYYADAPLSRYNIRTAWVTVVGRVTSATLEGEVNSLNCGRHLSLKRT